MMEHRIALEMADKGIYCTHQDRMHSHVDSANAHQETPAYGHAQSEEERILDRQSRESILYISSKYFHLHSTF